MSHLVAEKGYRYDYSLQTMKEIAYARWRDYDAEDTVRFYSLRLHANAVHALGPKQLEASGMHSTQERDRRLQVQLDDVARDEAHADINLVGSHRSRNTNPGKFGKADSRGFQRSVLRKRVLHANESCCAGRRERGQEARLDTWPRSCSRSRASVTSKHEAGMIKSTPYKIITQGADWRFFNELKRELKT